MILKWDRLITRGGGGDLSTLRIIMSPIDIVIIFIILSLNRMISSK